MPELSNDPVKLYSQIVGYIDTQQKYVAVSAALQMEGAFQLAEKIIGSLVQSDLLNTYAVNYYDTRDITISHAANVAIFTAVLAKGMRLESEEQLTLTTAALLHDVGFGRIPPQIVQKDPKLLLPGEQQIIEEHSLYSQDAILSSAANLENIATIVFQHHELSNGKGYPLHHTEHEIIEGAKIIGLIDTYEALLHPRSHRDALIPPRGIQQIMTQRGDEFPKRLIRALLEHITMFPVGTYIELSTNEIGRVIQTSPKNPTRPVVEIIYGTDGQELDKPRPLDLREEYLINIRKCVPTN